MHEARYPGICPCCGRGFQAGALLVRDGERWVLASCRPAPPAPGSAEEVYEILGRAKERADLADAARRAEERMRKMRGS
jgi:hypothetical protein